MENPYQICQLLLHLQNILQVFHTLQLCHLNNPELTPCKGRTMLLHTLDGTEYKTEIVLPVDLVKRESTRKL